MTKVYEPTGSAGSPSGAQMCHDNAHRASTFVTDRIAISGGGSNTPQVTVAEGDNADTRTYHASTPQILLEDWASGTYSVTIEVATGNADMEWDSFSVCRMDDSEVNQGKVAGTLSAQNEAMTAGTHTLSESGSAQSAAATDHIYLVCGMTNVAVMGDVSINIDQDGTQLSTPLVDPPPIRVGTLLTLGVGR